MSLWILIVNTIEEGEDVEVISGAFSGSLAKYINFSVKYRVIIEVNLESFITLKIPLKNIRKL